MPNVSMPKKAWPGQLIPIILAGGSGSRLAPLSTPENPKQFLRLFDGKTMLQQTIERSMAVSTVLPIIVTTEALAPHVRKVLLEMKMEHIVTLCEPSPRGTAASVMLVTRALGLIGDDAASGASFLVLPSDHHFLAPDAFYERVGIVYEALSRSDKVGLFGVRPDVQCTEKNSDYGFVLPVKPVAGQPAVASNFIEKPNKEVANTLREAGALWNSGIFVVSNAVLQYEMNQHKLGNVINSIMEVELNDKVLTLRADSVARTAWNELEILSLDNMLFPQTRDDRVAKCHGAVLADITSSGWSDVGTWEKLFQRIAEIDPDDSTNITYGQSYLTNCENCLVFNESDAPLRVRDLFNSIVINTATNGLSIYSRKVQPEDKAPYAGLAKKTGPATDVHRTALPQGSKVQGNEQRPWGSFSIISQGPRFKTKHLHVNPNCSLSHQVHQHRKEQWVVVVGSATVTLGEEVLLLQEGDSVTIPAGTWHRLENRGKLPLLVIEVQTGPYLEEDDIERRPA